MERRSDYAWGCPNTKRITAIISQNGNAYEDGFSDGWHPVRAFWADPNAEHRDALRHILSPDAVFRQYTQGVSNIELVAPDGYSLDTYNMAKHGALEAQLDLLLDYRSNVPLYAEFQKFFRTRRPPLLAVWGKKSTFSTNKLPNG